MRTLRGNRHRPAEQGGDAGDQTPLLPRPARTALLMTAACVALGLATYGPAGLGEYGRLDDYGYVFSSRTDDLDGLSDFYLDSGRPLPAFLMTTLAPQVSTIASLVWFRGISTLMLALGAAVAAVLTLRLVGRPGSITAILLALCTAGVALSTTSSPSAATWAILAGALHAFPAAMAAGLWATTSQRYWWVASAVLIAIAAFSYQHIAPLAVLPPMLWSAQRWAERRPARWSRTPIVGVMVVAALVANVLMVRARDGVGTSRITPVGLSERIQWFLRDLLPQTIDLGVPGTSGTLAWSAVLLVALLLAPLMAGPRYLMCSGAVVLAWAGTSMVVFPVELWASYRLASGAQYVLWVGAAVCFSIGAIHLKNGILRSGVVAAATCATLVSLVLAGNRAEDYLADPNEVDWAAMQCVVERHAGLEPGARIALNNWTSSSSTVIDMDEYGIVASSVPWAYPTAMWLAAAANGHEGQPDFEPGQLVVVPVGADTTGAVVVPQDGTCQRETSTHR